ncbi:MAG: HD domain-containing protein [Frankiales bacterium]|nr:HD domain-containing protein [Frankiales bacterium]
MTGDRELRSSGPLLVAAGLVVVASIAKTAQAGIANLAIALAFTAFIAIGEVLRITLPGGRQAAPLAAAGALAFALLPSLHRVDDVAYSVALAVTVVTIGSIVGAFPSALVGRGIHIDELARRVLTTLLAATLFGLVYPHVQPAPDETAWKLALAMTVTAAIGGAADAILAAGTRAAQSHAPFGTAVVDEFRALLGIASAIAATGVLIALATPRMDLWALPVFAVPLLLTQFSFRRYATIDATYLQTIRSLSKVTEVGGYTETGHSRRVSRLAVTIGREMGVSERDLTDLEYAALMHDIGQLSLPEPIPGGATTMVAPVDQRRIAELGAEVIRQAGVLDRAALIVERQADPYRPHRGHLDTTLPLESRIIKAVNAYDDLVGASLESDRKLRAIERLQLGIDREYDPAVVDTLSRIIERQTEYAY